MRTILYWLIGILALSLAANVWFVRKMHNFEAGGSDTIVVVDTLRVVEPIVRESLIVETVTRTLRVCDTIHVRDTILDSVAVEIPITQKVYRDSSYIAWVSGFDAKLDSLEVYTRETIIKPGRRRWGLGIQAGYGVHKSGLSPYIGIGVSYILN